MRRPMKFLGLRKPAPNRATLTFALRTAGALTLAAIIAADSGLARAQQPVQQATTQQAAARGAQPAQAQTAQDSQAAPQTRTGDLTQTSVEDLLNLEVTSVSKKQEKLSKTPAAVFVITREDIARSGATNIPDLLRMVPGLDVAQVNQSTWAIAARGFNDVYSNELLVTVDGRIVYTPSFGGVFWDTIDMPLEDIERIEVIRGSGGSIWGANAVNGIVNIITKSAADTHGAFVSAQGGMQNYGEATAQYGGKAGSATDYRIYETYSNEGALNLQDGTNGGDASHMNQIGFRSDSTLTGKDTLSIQGSLYQREEGTPTSDLASIAGTPTMDNVLFRTSGGFLQAAWHHTSSERFDTTLQVSYDQGHRADLLNENRRTIRADFQQRYLWGSRQTLVWGLDFANSDSDTKGSVLFSLDPNDRNLSMGSAFLEDEIAIVPDKLFFTIGTKIEHEFYNGFDDMPTARLAWLASPRQTFWAAVSKSIRTPSARDADSRTNVGEIGQSGGLPVVLSIFGNPNIQNESEVNWDAGYRMQIANRFSVDLALFYDHDTNQETDEPGAPFLESNPGPPHLVMPLVYDNLMYGEEHGIEMFGSWRISDRWTLSPGAAFEQIHMHLEPSSQDTGSVASAQGSSPKFSAQLRSHVLLPHRLGWDTSVYRVGSLADPVVQPFTRLDTGLTWNWSDNLSFSAFGQNLLKPEHLEFIDSTGSERSTLMKRGGYAKFTWTF